MGLLVVSYEQAHYLFTGGVKLAQSRGSSNSPDEVDIVAVMEAFEQMNSVILTLTGRVVRSGGRVGLKLEIQAHNSRLVVGEAPSLACASVTVGYLGRPPIGAAILQALYAVDAELARTEMEGAIKKP